MRIIIHLVLMLLISILFFWNVPGLVSEKDTFSFFLGITLSIGYTILEIYWVYHLSILMILEYFKVNKIISKIISIGKNYAKN